MHAQQDDLQLQNKTIQPKTCTKSDFKFHPFVLEFTVSTKREWQVNLRHSICTVQMVAGVSWF